MGARGKIFEAELGVGKFERPREGQAKVVLYGSRQSEEPKSDIDIIEVHCFLSNTADESDWMRKVTTELAGFPWPRMMQTRRYLLTIVDLGECDEIVVKVPE
jgi:hypothetical protein